MPVSPPCLLHSSIWCFVGSSPLSRRNIAPTMPHRLRSLSFATSSRSCAGRSSARSTGTGTARCSLRRAGSFPKSAGVRSSFVPRRFCAGTGHSSREVDEAASPARAPRDRSGGLQADPSDGKREPPVGIHEDQGELGKLGIACPRRASRCFFAAPASRERHQRDPPDKGFTSWGTVCLPLHFSLMSSLAIFSWSLMMPCSSASGRGGHPGT